MNFNLTFAGSWTTAAQNAVNSVATYLEGLFSDNIDVNITVQFGSIGGLGASSYSPQTSSYSQIVNALSSDRTTADDNTSVASLPGADPLTGTTHSYFLFKAQQKALGLRAGSDATSDGSITFSNSQSFDFDRSNGISAGQFDFMGTALHEFTEIMGRAMLTGTNNNAQTGPANGYYALDLFHYSGSGTRTFSGTTAGYFSPDNGATNVGAFNTNVNGDWGDWASSITNDAILAFSNPGVYNDFTSRDQRVMDVLGYNLVVDDHSDDVNFAGTGVVNGSVNGTLEHTLDSDWYRVQLSAGTHYWITVGGSDAGQGTLQHPFVAVYNSSSTQLMSAQEGSTNDARVEFTPSSSGFFYVDASSFFGGFTGTYAVHVQIDDIVSSTSTTGSVSADGGFSTGNLELRGDHDWFRATFDANQAYTIRESGSPTGTGTLTDAFLSLRDAAGTLIATDDDSGPGFNSRIIYHSTGSATDYVDAGGFNDNRVGTYGVFVERTQFHQDTSWTGAGNDGRWYVGDFNGDGSDDIFTFHAGVSGAEVELNSNGIAFSAATSWTGAGNDEQGWYVGDFNADGRDDVFRYHAGVSGAEVLLSNGSSFAAPVNWTGAGNDGHWYVGDFNGDGRDDIFTFAAGVSGALVSLSNGTAFSGPVSWTAAGNDPQGWYVGDFNGDGRDDIFRYNAGVSGAEVLLSNGSSFDAPVSWTGAGNDGRWYVGDFNGDGRDDIFRYNAGVSGADVFLSTGSSFAHAGSWTGASDGTQGWYTGNFDQEPGADIFRYSPGVSGADMFHV